MTGASGLAAGFYALSNASSYWVSQLTSTAEYAMMNSSALDDILHTEIGETSAIIWGALDAGIALSQFETYFPKMMRLVVGGNVHVFPARLSSILGELTAWLKPITSNASMALSLSSYLAQMIPGLKQMEWLRLTLSSLIFVGVSAAFFPAMFYSYLAIALNETKSGDKSLKLPWISRRMIGCYRNKPMSARFASLWANIPGMFMTIITAYNILDLMVRISCDQSEADYQSPPELMPIALSVLGLLSLVSLVGFNVANENQMLKLQSRLPGQRVSSPSRRQGRPCSGGFFQWQRGLYEGRGQVPIKLISALFKAFTMAASTFDVVYGTAAQSDDVDRVAWISAAAVASFVLAVGSVTMLAFLFEKKSSHLSDAVTDTSASALRDPLVDQEDPSAPESKSDNSLNATADIDNGATCVACCIR